MSTIDDISNEKRQLKTFRIKSYYKSNFHGLNNIMNQRLIAFVDYKKISRYFSNYNEKFQKNKPKINLEYFFNGKNLKNQTSRYESPYDLHYKKNTLLKNLVSFSQDIHTTSDIEKQFKKQKPQIKSFSINRYNTKYDSFVPWRKTNDIKFLSGDLADRINNKLLTFNFQDSKKLVFRYKKYYCKNCSTDRNNGNKKIIRKIKINKINSNNDTNGYNIKEKYNNLIMSKKKINLKANCYYNKLHLKKLSNLLTKYSYLDKDN